MIDTTDLWSFYENEFRGHLSEDEFFRWLPFAKAYLEDITSGRLGSAELPESDADKVKMALCAAVDMYERDDKLRDIASESNDGVSVTYRSGADRESLKTRLYRAAAMFLAGTGLLYRGC